MHYVYVLQCVRLDSLLSLYFLSGSLVTSNEMSGMAAFTLMKREFKSEEKIYLGSLY